MQIYRLSLAGGSRYYTADDPGEPAAPGGGESRTVEVADAVFSDSWARDAHEQIAGGKTHELRFNVAHLASVEVLEVSS